MGLRRALRRCNGRGEERVSSLGQPSPRCKGTCKLGDPVPGSSQCNKGLEDSLSTGGQNPQRHDFSTGLTTPEGRHSNSSTASSNTKPRRPIVRRKRGSRQRATGTRARRGPWASPRGTGPQTTSTPGTLEVRSRREVTAVKSRLPEHSKLPSSPREASLKSKGA